MPSKLENRFYLAAFLVALFCTSMTVSYMSGRTAEQAGQNREINTLIADEEAKAAYWEDKYQSLLHEADWLSVADAEAKFQERGQ